MGPISRTIQADEVLHGETEVLTEMTTTMIDNRNHLDEAKDIMIVTEPTTTMTAIVPMAGVDLQAAIVRQVEVAQAKKL